MPEHKRILVAVDFSEEAADALAWAAKLARSEQAELTVLHVYHPFHDYLDPKGYKATIEPRLKLELEKLVKQAGIEDLNPKLVLEEGGAADGTVGFAQRWKYDLIILGTHGRGGAQRLLLGSVAERVVRTSTVPVLTVPPIKKKD